MTAPVIIVATAGARTAVRVVPAQPVDRDRAFGTYPDARAYAARLRDLFGAVQIDDRCAWPRENARG